MANFFDWLDAFWYKHYWIDVVIVSLGAIWFGLCVIHNLKEWMKKSRWLVLVILLVAMPCYADSIDDLIPFIAQAESSGNSNAVSSKGAIGICQIMPIVLEEWNKYANRGNMPTGNPNDWFYARTIDLYNPSKNIIIAEWYLKRLRDHYLKYQISLLYSTPCNGADAGLTFHNQHFNNDEAALCMILGAYNMGPTRLKKLNYQWWRIEETKNYVFKVMKLYKCSNNHKQTE